MTAIVGKLAITAATSFAKMIGENIRQGLFGPAETELSKWMADQAAAHDNVVNRLEKAILSKAMDDERIAITTWQKELTERLQKAQNGDPTRLNELMADLRIPSTGIRVRLEKVYVTFKGTTKEGPYSGQGLIGVFMEELYTKLAKEDDFSFTVCDYLKNIEGFLDYHIRLQLSGLALRICAADKGDDTAPWVSEMEARLEEQIQYAYSLLPPMLRKMKPSLDTPMHAAHWWQFREYKSTHETLVKEYGTFQTKHIKLSGSAAPRPESEWRLRPALDAAPLPALQFRRDKSVVGHHPWTGTLPFGGTAHMHKLEVGASADGAPSAVFKVVPLKSADAGSEPAFRFVAIAMPERQRVLDGLSPTTGKPLVTTTFQLSDEGVGQWE